ncbi:insecticidal delta-endotoxin Cry8Ea1 family protein [Stenotrophomonas pennii]|uniref:insecticidal delta-endotoxin Cry8Ea1 family protein n=1 Tax=Stenotrophomonas lacuserhaii TaxID=2760084 RepID=UPI003209FACD
MSSEFRNSHLRNPVAPIEDPGRRRLMQSALAGSACLVAAPLLAHQGLVDSWGEPIDSETDARADDDALKVLRESLLAGLNLVPVVGGFLSYLGALFIPAVGKSAEQLWREIVDARISEALFQLVKADLIGLTGVAQLYANAVRSGDLSAISTQSVAANTQFVAAVPRFAQVGQEVSLLPLYVIAASLHLALLRDMALKAVELGYAPAYRSTLETQAKDCIARYTAHVDRHVAAALQAARVDNPYDWRKDGYYESNKPLTQMLQAKAALQIAVIDMRDTWYAFDPVRFPAPVAVRLDREVFSPIIGKWDRKNISPDVLPTWQRPASRLSELALSTVGSPGGALWIQGVHVVYQDGSEVETGMRAKSSGKRLALPNPSYYLRTIRARYAQGISRLEADYNTGTFWQGSGPRSSDKTTSISYAGHRVSSMRSVGYGRSPALLSVGSLIAGFQLLNQEAVPISLETYDRVAPNIAPQLLHWIAG